MFSVVVLAGYFACRANAETQPVDVEALQARLRAKGYEATPEKYLRKEPDAAQNFAYIPLLEPIWTQNASHPDLKRLLEINLQPALDILTTYGVSKGKSSPVVVTDAHRALLQKYRPYIDPLRASRNLPYAQGPVLLEAGIPQVNKDALSALRLLGQLMALDALEAFAANDPNRAAADIITLYRICDAGDGPTTVQCNQAMAMQVLASELILYGITLQKWTPESLRLLQNDPRGRKAAVNLEMSARYLIALFLNESPASGASWTDVAQSAGGVAQAGDLARSSGAAEAYRFLKTQLPEFTIKQTFARAMWADTTLQIAQTAVLLEMERLKTGSYPDKLLPSMQRVAFDPMTRGPMGYKKVQTGYLLYSTGIDGEDNKGRLPASERGDVATEEGCDWVFIRP